MNNKGTKIKIRIIEKTRTRKTNKENNFSLFYLLGKSLVKITAILLITALNWAGLSAVIETIAYYNDTENSNINTYEAGTLDFYLDSPSSNFIPLETVANMKVGDLVSREISVINATGSNPFQYIASTTQTGGNTAFCNSLKLEAKLEGVTKYSDGLMNFNLTSPIMLGDDGRDDWLFTVTLPTGATFTPGNVCQIKFVFTGSQTKNHLPFGQGFYDTEEIASSFAAGGIKINKVYYDVDTAHGAEYANEWIEIYNPLDNPVDISGWIIEDNNATDTIPASDPIPGHGFAIISASSTTWQYWNITNGVIKIVLADGKIGNGLDDNSDRVILKMPSGTEDDAMSYGTDTYAFTPPRPDVAEGHILARVPTGLDTNTASDWKDLGLPSLTLDYPVGGETWYVGHDYNIRWTATNHNGLDGDLVIDIYYSKNSGNTWAAIATSTQNDGSFEWHAPLFIEPGHYYVPSSYARIKVVAFGPENFMVQAWASSNDFCPPIDYDVLSLEDQQLVDQLIKDGVIDESEVVRGGVKIDEQQAEVVNEEIATPTEETLVPAGNDLASNGNQESGGVIETVNEVIDAADGAIDTVVEGIVEEIMPDEPSGETVEVPTDDMIVEDTIIEPALIEETLIIEQAPATEEQAVIAPEADSAEPPAGE